MMPPVAILAGGLATRLGAVTQSIPKALVEVAGRPFVEHQLGLLAGRGITDVVFLLGHRANQIEAAVGDGRRFGLRVRYAHDGPRLLGTGGAVRQARDLIAAPTFFLLYGDSYLDCDYDAIAGHFRASGRLALMTVVRNDNRWDRSNVLFDRGEIRRYDKSSPSPEMCHIDYGLSVFDASAFEDDPPGEPLDLASVQQRLLAAGQLAAYEVHERFYEIGSASGLAETDAFLRRCAVTLLHD